MTAGNVHATPEQLADLHEDLLPDDEKRSVAAHLGTCPDCTEKRNRLAQLSVLMRTAPSAPMPDSVIARLDSALAEESRRRAAEARPAGKDRDPGSERVVVPLQRTGRDRTRRWLAVAGAAAAMVVGVSLVGDLLPSTSSPESSSADSDAAAGLSEDAGQPETELSGPLTRRIALPNVRSATFAADVEALRDRNPAWFGPAPGGDRGDSPGLHLPGPADSSESAALRNAIRSCTAEALSRAGVQGRYGLFVRVDGRQVSRLVTLGRPDGATVVAYSCPGLERLAATRLDRSG